MRTKNLLKEKVLNRQVAIGSWVTIGHPEITEILSLSSLNFDFFVYEMEHTALTLNVVENLMATTASSVTPVVRPVSNLPFLIEQALDIGAQGLLVPLVDTAREAAQAASSARYPPEGTRGSGAGRAADYGTRMADYRKTANEQSMVIVQIESQKGVESAEEIITTPGVDAWFIGLGDLSMSLGHPGEFDNPLVQDAIAAIIKAGDKADVPGGTFVPTIDKTRAFIEKGYKLLILGSDTRYLISGAGAALDEVRKVIQK